MPLDKDRFEGMVGEAGIEPTTPGLEGRCSIQLSYSPLYDSFYGIFRITVESPSVYKVDFSQGKIHSAAFASLYTNSENAKPSNGRRTHSQMPPAQLEEQQWLRLQTRHRRTSKR